jgi:hypothetical protein
LKSGIFRGDQLRVYVHSRLGDDVASKFLHWLKLVQDLGDPLQVFADPEAFPIPSGDEARQKIYGLLTCLAGEATKTPQRMEAFDIFLRRVDQSIGSQELSGFAASYCQRVDPIGFNCPAGQSLINRYQV